MLQHKICLQRHLFGRDRYWKTFEWSEWIALRRFLLNHGNIATEKSPTSGLCPTLIEWVQGFFTVHSTIDSTAHSVSLKSLEHCICSTPMPSIRIHYLWVSSHNRSKWALGAVLWVKYNAAPQSQKAVSAYLKSEQILPVGFARQNIETVWNW